LILPAGPLTGVSGPEEARRCAVTGLGIVSAAGPAVRGFQAAIHGLARERPAGPCPAGACPPAISRHPRDRAFRLAVQALCEAATQAGLADRPLPLGGALVLGTTLGGALKAQRWHEALLAGRPTRRADLLQAPLHALGDHLARHFGLDGPCLTVSNACVSGTDALGLALDLIRSGEAERVFAGGVDTLHRFNRAGFSCLGILSDDDCRPFDPERRGIRLGEAAAFLVLESAAAARRRGAAVLAELAGYGSACDALHVTAPDPAGGGAGRAIAAALEDAGVGPCEVDFISLHGVGTRFGDGMEAAALGRVFGRRACCIPATSLRPVVGHTLGSAGAVDSVACVLAITEGTIPPTANHRRLDPELAAPLRIVRQPLVTPVRVALNTSSGFGGVNAAVVFKRWQVTPE
jgi:3-oxoacyl-[acyl-carrier-protein] synthase II